MGKDLNRCRSIPNDPPNASHLTVKMSGKNRKAISHHVSYLGVFFAFKWVTLQDFFSRSRWRLIENVLVIWHPYPSVNFWVMLKKHALECFDHKILCFLGRKNKRIVDRPENGVKVLHGFYVTWQSGHGPYESNSCAKRNFRRIDRNIKALLKLKRNQIGRCPKFQHSIDEIFNSLIENWTPGPFVWWGPFGGDHLICLSYFLYSGAPWVMCFLPIDRPCFLLL